MPGRSIAGSAANERAGGAPRGVPEASGNYGMTEPPSLSRARYADLYGPTAGDRIRLADTNLLIEITEDRSRGAGPSGQGGAGQGGVFGRREGIRGGVGQGPATRAQGPPPLRGTGGWGPGARGG